MIRALRNKIYKALRKVEPHAKTDLVYFVKGGSWLSLGHVVAVLSGFLLSIAFANLFPKESFGTYKFILSVAAILGAFSLTGIGSALTRAVARGFEGSLRYGFRLSLKWSFGVLLGGSALAVYYFLNGNTLLSVSFLLAGVLVPIIGSANLYIGYLLGKKDFRRNTLYGIVQNAAPAAAIIASLFLTDSIVIVIAAHFTVGALMSLALYIKTRRVYRNQNQAVDPGLLSYSGHLSAMEIIGRLAAQLDKVLVFHYLGPAPLAIYAFATAPVEQLQIGKKILGVLALPKLSGRPFEELQKSTPKRTGLLVIYALLLAGLYSLFAPYLFRFIYPQYLDSVIYSQIYSLTLLAIAAAVPQETLVAHKKTRELYLQRIIVPVVQIGLFMVLLPLYNLMGLIVTHVFIRSFSALLAFYFVMHPLPRRVETS